LGAQSSEHPTKPQAQEPLLFTCKPFSDPILPHPSSHHLTRTLHMLVSPYNSLICFTTHHSSHCIRFPVRKDTQDVEEDRRQNLRPRGPYLHLGPAFTRTPLHVAHVCHSRPYILYIASFQLATHLSANFPVAPVPWQDGLPRFPRSSRAIYMHRLPSRTITQI